MIAVGTTVVRTLETAAGAASNDPPPGALQRASSSRVVAALRDSPAEVDYASDFGVVGEMGGSIAGIAHYFRSRRSQSCAEVAFAIADRYQGFGIGTHLLQKLADIGRTLRIEEFRAEVLPENHKMLDVFLASGFDVRSRSAEGTVHVSFAIASTEQYQDRAAERSRKAAYASMRSIFEPRSIAVVGAGRKRGQLGSEILHNLRTTGFTGSLFAVNPNANEIDGVPSFPAVSAIEGPVDLAVIAVPAEHVEAVVDEAGSDEVGVFGADDLDPDRQTGIVQAGRDHGGGRQYPDPLIDDLRSGRHALPSLSV